MKRPAITHQLLFLLMLTGGAFAQPPDTVWTRQIGTEWSDYASGIDKQGDSLFVAVGVTTPDIASGSVGYVLAFNQFGDTLWTRQFGDSNVTEVNSVTCSGTGYCYFTGSSFELHRGAQITVGKMGTDGRLIWLVQLLEINAWRGYNVKQDPAGDLIVAGGKPFNGITPDAVVVKMDTAGQVIWMREVGGSGGEHFESVCCTSDGCYIAVGVKSSNESGAYGMYAAKFSPLGDTIWTRVFHEGIECWARAITANTDSTYLIVGHRLTESTGRDIMILEIDSSGQEVWRRFLGGTEDDLAFDFTFMEPGQAICCGSTNSYGNGNSDVYLAQIDVLGDTTWTATYGTALRELAHSICILANGEIVLAGNRQRDNTHGDSDVYVVFLDPAMSSSGSRRSYSQNSQLSIFPNPFNTIGSIEIISGHSGPMELSICNTLGRVVDKRRVHIVAGSPIRLSFNGSQWSSGVYYCNVTSNNLLMTQKMFLLR